jgi:ATP-dependent Clp protease adaptor protein ClpS
MTERSDPASSGAAEPSLHRVLILNDDKTPMEFVVHVLEHFFDHDHETAVRLMLQAHHAGAAACGYYSEQAANAKVAEVIAFAREHRHPLQCIVGREA